MALAPIAASPPGSLRSLHTSGASLMPATPPFPGSRLQFAWWWLLSGTGFSVLLLLTFRTVKSSFSVSVRMR